MRKALLLRLIAIMMAMGALCGCGDNDSDRPLGGVRKELIGTWCITSAFSGWGGMTEYEAGDVTVTFTGNGEARSVNRRDDQRPVTTGTRSYELIIIESSIFTHEPVTAIVFSGPEWTSQPFTLNFVEGSLHLSQEAFDGIGYTLRRTAP